MTAQPVLPIVRDEIRRLLMRSGAFRSLPEAQRNELAHSMVRVANYMVGGRDGRTAPHNALIAAEQATGKVEPKVRPNTASGDMKESGAAAADAGVDALAEAVEKVDFPKFVSGLIDGVFNAIVNASIKQMEAYAELVKNVAKSVDDFMKDNVTSNQARDYLVDRYPDQLELETNGESPVVRKRPSAEESTMPDFFGDLGLPAPTGGGGVDDETVESQLVPAARRRIAMDRQQLLATMVLMGINRIIVTDGSIKASVQFDLSTRDAVQRAKSFQSTATYREQERSRYRPGFVEWFGGYNARNRSTDLTVTTVQSSKDDSQSQVDLKAKLAGEVNVRFRSETFPLEKMTDLLAPDMREKVQGRLPPQTTVQTATPAPLPQAPPLPSLGGSPLGPSAAPTPTGPSR